MSAGEGSGAFEAPERWRRLREVLEEALERPEGERQAWLRSACDGDAELEREARRLLALEEGSRELEPPTASELALAAAPAGRPAQRIGPWELVREIGRGGMGSVWLARRADGAYERRVALKILHARPASGAERARLLERFRRERQVLANLDHPNIARLLEGGETEEGEPYLVMEYVEGRPIDRHCDEQRLPLEARLELFGKVCDAVHYAHRNLVVHRDLKPGNVLVTPDGEPKLLDFGIAKVLDAEKSSSAPELTLGLLHFLTPAYASPEQVTGRPITTASDVYSLGVVLYHLLAGELPHRVETTSAAEIERIVCEEEPRQPSAAVARAAEEGRAEAVARARLSTPRALRRALEGDLDNVVLTALRKEPWRRYASAERLAEDLRRHLAGLPVAARPDTFGYRAGKLLRRHRAAFAAAALVLLSLVAGLVTTARQSVRAERARAAEREQRELAEARLAESQRLAADLAEQRTTAEERLAEVQELNEELERQRALAQARFDDVRGFATRLIFDVHRAIHPLEGATQAIELVVSTGIESLDRLAAQAGDDAPLARELGQAYLRMAEIQGSTTGNADLGQTEAAGASLEKARALAAGLVAAEPDDPRNTTLLAHALLMRGDLARSDGRSAAAHADYLAALEACRGVAELADPKPGHLFVLQAVQASLADFLAERSCEDEVRERYASCIAIVQRLVDGWPQLASMESEIGELHADLALWHARCGWLDEALAASERALEILERLAERAPAHAPLQRQVHAARCQRASLLIDRGELERAAPVLDEGRRFFAAQLAADPSNVHAREDLVLTWRRSAALQVRAGDWEAARRAWEEQLELVQPLAGERGSARHRMLLADASAGLGESLVQQGLFLEAGPHLERARSVLEELTAADPDDVNTPYMLASVYALLGGAHARAAEQGTSAARAFELERAVTWLERALATGETLPGRPTEIQLGRLEGAREELERCRADLAALRQP